ncbi:MAG TPA: hypothetical protein GXZ77_01915 [Papillibacter sp.]|jgi:hypothetical protein|nr:hypothetical protein [Papillibacter sp.]
MSNEKFWDLFAETGDIEYYLLYAKKPASSEDVKQECDESDLDAAP